LSVTFQLTDTAMACARSQYCSAGTIIATPQSTQGSVGGSVGAGTKSTTITASGASVPGVWFELALPADLRTLGAANWTVNLDVTVANSNLTWVATYICRVNSGCTNQATIGSLTAQATSLGTTGTKSHVVSGSSAAFAAGDKVIIILCFTNGKSSTQAFTWKADSTVVSASAATYGESVTGALTGAATNAPGTSMAASTSAAGTLAAVNTPNLAIPAATSAALTAAMTSTLQLAFGVSISSSITAALVYSTQAAFVGSVAGAGTAAATLASALRIPAANSAALTAALVAAPGLVVPSSISANGTLDAAPSARQVFASSIAQAGTLAVAYGVQLAMSKSIAGSSTLAAVHGAKLDATGAVSGGLTAALVLATRTTFVGAASAALNNTAVAATVVRISSTIAPSIAAATTTTGTTGGGGNTYDVGIAQALVAALAAQATYSVPCSVVGSAAAAVSTTPANQVAAPLGIALVATYSTVCGRAVVAEIVGATLNVCDIITEPLELDSSITDTTQLSSAALAGLAYVGSVVVLQTLDAAFPFFITGSSAAVQPQTHAEGSTVTAMDATGGTE
jgi:hypothetical protein